MQFKTKQNKKYLTKCKERKNEVGGNRGFSPGQGARLPATVTHVRDWATPALPAGLLTGVQLISDLLASVLQAQGKVISLCTKH